MQWSPRSILFPHYWLFQVSLKTVQSCIIHFWNDYLRMWRYINNIVWLQHFPSVFLTLLPTNAFHNQRNSVINNFWPRSMWYSQDYFEQVGRGPWSLAMALSSIDWESSWLPLLSPVKWEGLIKWSLRSFHIWYNSGIVHSCGDQKLLLTCVLIIEYQA